LLTIVEELSALVVSVKPETFAVNRAVRVMFELVPALLLTDQAVVELE
jgi:hypothetical protein